MVELQVGTLGERLVAARAEKPFVEVDGTRKWLWAFAAGS